MSPTAPPLTDYPKELERIAEAIRKYIHFSRTSVDITVDEEWQQIVTRVLDEDSGKVIRQYPEDAALVVMKHLKELRGLLLHKKG
ncbi:MAG: flagellar protein FlaG [Candidatus Deferrimicrobiaceae bacterium]